jgi:uncharacterized protein YndB with AHSA1/START domain
LRTATRLWKNDLASRDFEFPFDGSDEMPTNSSQKIDGISSEAVRKGTGQSWEEWLDELNLAGADAWSHKEIVAYIQEHHDLSPWWQQMVTVGYEKGTAKRVDGETADAGFQMGVQKTFPLSAEESWKLLISKAGASCWLGKIARFAAPREGKTYRTDSGVTGEFRVVKPPDRLRLVWHPPELKRPATLQIALTPGANGKTAIRAHLEKLSSPEEREAMKSHWKRVLAELASLIDVNS